MRFAARAAVLGTFLPALAYAVASCIDVDSLGNGPVRPDAAEEEEQADSQPPLDPCPHAGPPGPPTIDDAPGETLPPFELAVDKADIDPVTVPGFDLDGLCTCDTRPFTAGDGGPSCAAKGGTTCDSDGGIDNAVGAIASFSGVLEIDNIPNAFIAAGRRTLLLQIAKYNGRANDAQVEVSAYPTEGITDQGCDASTFDPGNQVWTPGRCGEDRWSLSPIGVVTTGGGSPRPASGVGVGYVHDFHLVVRFGNPVVIPYGATADLRFSSTLLTGKIVPLDVNLNPRDPSRPPQGAEERLFRLEQGVLGGRIAPNNILTAIGPYPQADASLCATPAWDLIRSAVCGGVDIRFTQASAIEPTAPCDALSIALGVVALPARIGAVSDAAIPTNPCGTDLLACPQ